MYDAVADPAAAVVVPAPQRAPFFRVRDAGPQFLAPIHRAMVSWRHSPVVRYKC
jgi:hypothetical protein